MIKKKSIADFTFIFWQFLGKLIQFYSHTAYSLETSNWCWESQWWEAFFWPLLHLPPQKKKSLKTCKVNMKQQCGVRTKTGFTSVSQSRWLSSTDILQHPPTISYKKCSPDLAHRQVQKQALYVWTVALHWWRLPPKHLSLWIRSSPLWSGAKHPVPTTQTMGCHANMPWNLFLFLSPFLLLFQLITISER